MNQSKAWAGVPSAQGLCDTRLQAALEDYCLKHLSAVQLARLRALCRQVDSKMMLAALARWCFAAGTCRCIDLAAAALHPPFMHNGNAVEDVMLVLSA